VPVEEVDVLRKEGVRELRRGAAGSDALRKPGRLLLIALDMVWPFLFPFPVPFCIGTGGGDIELSTELELGSRYVYTWPVDRPTLKMGCVGCRARVKMSEGRGRVQIVSNMVEGGSR
jgi:hypothetical protein